MIRQKDLIHKTDWELLIILDACRFDYFKENYQDYINGKLTKAHSEGIDTFEFLRKCFPDYYDLTYVSGATPVNSVIKPNPHGMGHLYRGYVPRNHFERIIDVWNFGWSDSLGTVPPHRVTTAAINNISEKMIVHYFQPHAPFISEPKLLGFTGNKVGKMRGIPPDSPIWENAKENVELLKKAYEGNLRLVLLETKRLLEVIGDFFNKIVITSDHGEGLGEDGVFGHNKNHRILRVIPWLEVEK